MNIILFSTDHHSRQNIYRLHKSRSSNLHPIFAYRHTANRFNRVAQVVQQTRVGSRNHMTLPDKAVLHHWETRSKGHYTTQSMHCQFDQVWMHRHKRWPDQCSSLCSNSVLQTRSYSHSQTHNGKRDMRGGCWVLWRTHTTTQPSIKHLSVVQVKCPIFSSDLFNKCIF